jgi:hypothetical protein
MPFPGWLAGQIITADRLNDRNVAVVTQENDQIVTSSITPIDSEIILVPQLNALYQYAMLISYSATVNNGIRWQWNATGATFTSFTQSISNPGASGTSNTAQQVNMRRPANTTGRLAGGSDAASPPANFHSAYDWGTFVTDGTGASITMQWAQAVSHANQSILRGGNQTRMLYWRIG